MFVRSRVRVVVVGPVKRGHVEDFQAFSESIGLVPSERDVEECWVQAADAEELAISYDMAGVVDARICRRVVYFDPVEGWEREDVDGVRGQVEVGRGCSVIVEGSELAGVEKNFYVEVKF